MTNETKALKSAYPPFAKLLDFDEFSTRVNSLGNEARWNFVRASLLYQQALKCKGCEPNVAMLLLCSCADALKIAGEGVGSRKNFRELYLKYCPSGLRVAPINFYPNRRPPLQDVPFGRALDLVYSKFRCLYVHEGIGKLELPPEDMKLFMHTSLESYGNDIYHIDILRILEWFANITFESLRAML